MTTHDLSSTSLSLSHAQGMYDRFCTNTTNTVELNACVETCKQIMENEALHDVKLFHLSGKAFCSQAIVESNVQDLDKGLEVLHKAAIISNPSSELGFILTDIASALHARWDLIGIVEDLQDSISLRRLTLSQCTLLSSQRQLRMIRELSTALFLRFTHFPRLFDLHEAIALAEQALSLAHSTSDRFEGLCTLAQMFLIRFDYDGVVNIREQAITLLREAVLIAPTLGKPLDWALALNGLSEAIQGLVFVTSENVEECFNLDNKALELIPKNHPERLPSLAAMATTVLVRFTLREEAADWERYQSLQEDISAIITSMKPKHDDQFEDFSWALFQNMGHFTDRYALCSIFLQSKYIKRAETEWLKTEVTSRSRRVCQDIFLRRLIDPIGYETALVRERVMIRSISSTNQSLQSLYIGNLAWGCRGIDFTGMDTSNLQVMSRDEVKTFWLSKAPKNHPWEFAYYSELAHHLYILFEGFCERNLMDEAFCAIKDSLEYSKKAVDLQLSLNHPFVHQNSCIVAWACIHMAETFPNMISKEVMDEAIKYGSMTVQYANRIGRPGEDSVHAYAYITRFDLFEDLVDLDVAVEILRKALERPNVPASIRYVLADHWVEAAEKYNHKSQMEAHIFNINCLIEYFLIDFSMVGMTEMMRNFQISDALAAATEYCISHGTVRDVLYILGRGRGIFWARLLQLKYQNFIFLKNSKPNEFSRLKLLLEAADMERQIEARPSLRRNGTSNNYLLKRVVFPNLNYDFRHRRLNFDTNRLLREVRKDIYAENPDDPTTWRSFLDCIPEGCFPVIVLNAAKDRCDALIIQSTQGLVEHVALPHCTRSQLDILVKRKEELLQIAGIAVRNTLVSVRLGLRKVENSLIAKDGFEVLLEDVWRMIIEPVVRALHLKPTPTPKRVWWYPVGPFWQVPLHAAGNFQGTTPIGVQDYFVSSYLPPFNMSARKGVKRSQVNLLAVYQSKTDGLPSLPEASREVEVIRNIVAENSNAHLTELGDKEATRPAILQAVKAANIVHFALHAQQHFEAPLESCLLLQSKHDILKLSELMEMELPNADIVFLSACETATGNKIMPEEVIHVAAAMLFIGFKGAMGTMWSIADCDGPVVAQETYQYLLAKKDFDPRDSAYALHHAVQCLRRLNIPPIRWVPFIHIGI